MKKHQRDLSVKNLKKFENKKHEHFERKEVNNGKHE